MINDFLEENEELKIYELSINEIFNSIDKDGDGLIGIDEIINYLTSIIISFRS